MSDNLSIDSTKENYTNAILSYIEGSKPVGDFADGGESKYCPIKIEVEDVGRIAFPLCSEQAKLLISKARVGPFGRGSETIVDTTVRKVWEIQKDKVLLSEEFITGLLQDTVNASCANLGLSGDLSHIKANLYKLLVYEEGGFFKKHQDTEKEAGMFATLLIQLPALHTGGDLVVKHMGKVKRFAHSMKSDDRIYYNAFYTDCEHELEPVLSGYRMVLAFNLIKTNTGKVTNKPLPSASNFVSELQVIESAIKNWAEDNARPNKLAYRLDHQYTSASISFNTLKGRDKEIYDRLRLLKDKFGDPLLSIKMVVMEKEEQGEAEASYHGGYSGMDFVNETEVSTKEWIHNDEDEDEDEFSQVDISTELLVAEDQDPEDAAFDDDHDESQFEGFTGNEGSCLSSTCDDDE